MKAAHTLFQFPPHFEGSDLKSTLENSRFYPLIPHITATALRADEADILIQHHQTDALLFAYLQSVTRKPFDIYLDVPSDSLFFVFNELGVSVWDIKGYSDYNYSFSGCQSGFSVKAGRHRKLVVENNERLYCFAVTGVHALHAITCRLAALSPMHHFIRQPDNEPVSLPVCPFLRETTEVFSSLLYHKKHPVMVGGLIEQILFRLLILYNDRLTCLTERQQSTDKPGLYERAMEHISIHFHDRHLNIGKIADALCTSVSTLEKAFRAESRKVYSTISDVRMKHAASLLLSTDRSIADIAAASGCYNPSNFTKVFRRVFRVSPNQFRQRK